MKITRNVFSISDLCSWLNEKTLEINRDYQRGSGLWPVTARSYFIDTILNEYPFPKITIRQIIDLKTNRSKREVVDGQQRILTIKDFLDNNLTLTSVSKQYAGKKYKDLTTDEQEAFLAYEVSVDTITVGTNEEVLEIFRRMNSYTLPLNDAEKRHATYQGRFKWFILELLDVYSPFLESAKILSVRDIGRMRDADLMTELVQVILSGVEDRTIMRLNNLYKQNDTEGQFTGEKECKEIIHTTLNFIRDKMSLIFENDKIPAYFFYSIFSALVYNKYGLKNISKDIVGYESIGTFSKDIATSMRVILDMFREADNKNEESRYSEFVKACTSSTQRIANRRIRLKWLVKALQEPISL